MSTQVATLPEHRQAHPGRARHDDGSVVGGGCDDQFEFEFALDLMLDGLERLRKRYAAGKR